MKERSMDKWWTSPSSSDEDMNKIDKLDKNTPFYNQTDESLEAFASWNPDFDAQK